MFYTGEPCVKGHLCARWTTDTRCYECAKQRVRDKYKNNPEKEKQRCAEYGKRPEVRVRNAARIRELRKILPDRFATYEKTKYQKMMADPIKREKELERQRNKEQRKYQKNPEAMRAKSREWHKNNIELAKERAREYRQKNPHIIRALNLKHNAKDRAARKKRLPKWVGEEELQQIVDMYRKARQLGLHVDHIIPLQGKNVSGLHVLSNLQLLTPSENCAKKNYYEVE